MRYNHFNKYSTKNIQQESFSPNVKYTQTIDDFKKNLFMNTYSEPHHKDMLIILPFFNPCNSIRILQNLLLVKSKLEVANIPYIIIHCLFPNSIPISNETSTYLTVKSNSYAFVKENLANIVINKCNDKYKKFLIHDCDIIFENTTWYENISNELNTYDIIQPYKTYKNLNYNFIDITDNGLSLLYSKSHNGKECYDGRMGHTGYLIAFTKQFWDIHGYPEEALIGGGDTLIMSIILKTPLFTTHHNAYHMSCLYKKYINDITIKWGYSNETIYHLYHNLNNNRQYTTRYFILSKYINNNTPYKTILDIIKKNKDGVYEWNDDIRDDINKDILDYFTSRQDDEIYITQLKSNIKQ